MLKSVVFKLEKELRMKLELVNVDRQKPPIVLDQFPVIVGLDPGADLCLDDSSVGHYQCMIDYSDGALMVWDLGTKTGTTINGVRIARKSPLRPGDEIGIGKNCFLARYENGAHPVESPVATVMAAPPPASSHRRRQPVAQA